VTVYCPGWIVLNPTRTKYTKNKLCIKLVFLSNNKTFKSVSMLPIVVSADPMPPTRSTSSAFRIPEKTEEIPDDPKPVDEGDIRIDYSYD